MKNSSKSGAIQQEAPSFFAITYPSVDLIKCLEAIAPGQERTVVLMGGRGHGKSHMLAAVFHALTSPAAGKAWLTEWAGRLAMPHLASLDVRPGLRVISDPSPIRITPAFGICSFRSIPTGSSIAANSSNRRSECRQSPS